MYEKQFPDIDEEVVVLVNKVIDMGVYVTLLEYNNAEGMIPLSELSRRRIRSIGKLIRVGRQEIVAVLRVDRDKGYIDLSKKRLTADECVKYEEKYQKSKAVHSIMRQCAEMSKTDLEDLYKMFCWGLYKKYGHAYDAFKLLVASDDFSMLDEYNMTPEMVALIVKNVRRRLTPQPVKMRTDIEVMCYSYEGIEAIRAALLAGKACSTEDCPIKVKLVAPPKYVMDVITLDKEKGAAILNLAVEKVREEITKRGGKMTMKVAPRVTTERDDKELQSELAALERQNQEVAGDDSGEEEEESSEEED